MNIKSYEMKHMKLFVAASVMMLSIGMSAQPQGGRPMPPKQRTPEEIAKKESEQMKFEVNLTEKQYKKVYNLIKKDQEYRQSQTGKQFKEGLPPQGRGLGMGAPGGMGSGIMGGGSMGGGRPPLGEMGQGPRPEGGHPRMEPREDVVTEEYLEKQDKKLRKILTAEQYSKWRSKHPVEHLELPPVEF